MLLKYFYDERLAHASYLVGCQAIGEAFVVDPARNIQPYLDEAEREGMKLTGVLETHIHADYVSGAYELGKEHGVKLYVSDEGDENWKYEYVDGLDYELLKDGDKIELGKISFEVMHTPGHTPESISFLLTDGGAHADEPVGIFTGDFVFVGDIGRPDLLEEAAGIEDTAIPGAKEMFKSVKRFAELPDFVQVWPAHGAGSACGKSLGAVPSTTVGYEKRFGWAFQYNDEAEFVEALLEGQPEAPKYFAVMKHVNKVGPTLTKDLPSLKKITDINELTELIENDNQVLDLRDHMSFAKNHIRGTFNIPNSNALPNWAGWLVDYDRPLYLLAKSNQLNDILIALRSVGIDNIVGYMDIDQALAEVDEFEGYLWVSTEEAAEKLSDDITIIDVRNQSEWDEGYLPKSKHLMLGKLIDQIDEVPKDKPVLVLCQAGGRAAIAASILKSKGVQEVYSLTGGYGQWNSEGRQVSKK